MQERPNDTWFLIKKLSAIVREGLQLVTDAPSIPKLRVDPDGERESEERRRHHEEWEEKKRASGIDDSTPPDMIMKMPRLKTIHLQWLDTSYGPVWRDTDLHVNLDEKRMYSVSGVPFLGGGHKGSGAIGVVIFASPALLVLSPYIIAKNARWQSRERKEGMSRHAIVLMERLKGLLDPETEALLREALRNDWTHHRKMTRSVTFAQARAALTECELVESRFGRPDRHPRGVVRYWRDADGDVIAHGEAADESPNPLVIKVFGSAFEGADAEKLLGVYLHRREAAEDED